ncbi:MAG: fumarylacetoacetate hydrolase family protein [Anaerolineales bacterium]|nr:fumarylacetoacetate hydrolase family protein [Anaerolineales bacterium]
MCTISIWLRESTAWKYPKRTSRIFIGRSARFIARASDTCELQAGDVIGSHGWDWMFAGINQGGRPVVERGDIVELEVERIGNSKNIVGRKNE